MIASSKIAFAGLILSNIVTVLFVYLYDWSVFNIIFVYWIENLVVCLYFQLKIRKMAGQGQPYAYVLWIFTVFHGLVIIGLWQFMQPVCLEAYKSSLACDVPFNVPLLDFIKLGVVPGISMILSHGASYYENFLGKKEYERSNLQRIFETPMQRIFVIHMTVIVGGALSVYYGTYGPLFFFIALKMFMDVKLHLKEHATKAFVPSG